MIKKSKFYAALCLMFFIFLDSNPIVVTILLGMPEEQEPIKMVSANLRNIMEIKLRETFAVWILKPDEETITGFSITFDDLLFEGEENIFGGFDKPLPGKKYVKIPYHFKNLGPRKWIGNPGMRGELEIEKGYIYPEEDFYSRIKKYADSGEEGNGHLIFLIPIDAKPVKVNGTIGNHPWNPFETKPLNFCLTLPQDTPSLPAKLIGHYSPSMRAKDEIELIDHYLIPGPNPELHIEYKNTGNRILGIFLGMSWMDERSRLHWQQDRRGPIAPDECEQLIYDFKISDSPEKITSYTIYFTIENWPSEPWPPPPYWNPEWPKARLIVKSKGPIVTTAPALIQKINLSEKDLSLLVERFLINVAIISF